MMLPPERQRQTKQHLLSAVVEYSVTVVVEDASNAFDDIGK